MKFSNDSILMKLSLFVQTSMLFLFVFGVPFSFVSINSSKILIILLLLLFPFWGSFRFLVHTSTFVISVFSFLLFMCILSCAYTIFHGTLDFSVGYSYLIYAVEDFLGALLFISIFSCFSNIDNLISGIYRICVLQAIIIILMLVNDSFRDFIFAITDTSATELFERYDGFRGTGLAGSLTYDLSVFLSVGFIFGIYLYISNISGVFYSAVTLILIFVSVLVTGRTGLIGVFFGLLFLFHGAYRFPIRILKLLLISLFVFVAVIIFILSIDHSLHVLIYEKILPYAFEFAYSTNSTGLSTESSDELQKMYFSISQVTFWIGDGFWFNPSNGTYYQNTDAGYMRHILFYGIFPSVLLYCFYAYLFIHVIRFNQQLSRKLMYLLLFLLFFIVHYKGDFLLGSPMNIKIFCLLILAEMINEKNSLYN